MNTDLTYSITVLHHNKYQAHNPEIKSAGSAKYQAKKEIGIQQ
jgi:hypothetical protein